MDHWLDGVAAALAYLEAHLTEPLDIPAAARQAYVSPFYFQRLFSALCGMTVGEYVRRRRLTLAGEMLQGSRMRVLDAALACGYDSPDSFNRAFRRFHGVSPSQARRAGVTLQAQPPLKIRLTLEGDRMLEYRIEEKAGFTLAGMARTFRPDTSYQDIPRYWLEVMDMARPPVMGTFGVCIDGNAPDGAFEYLIADIHTPGAPLPPGCVLREIPALTWAVFPCRGPLPDALQEVNTRMWGEWLPNTRAFRLAANLNVEAYFPQKDYCELWLPVERVAE